MMVRTAKILTYFMRVYRDVFVFVFSSYLSHYAVGSSSWEWHIFTYVMPKIPITSSATEITRFEVHNGMFFHHGNKVDALAVSASLDSLFRFLEKLKNVVLVGHNIKTFDCPVLLQVLESCLLLSKLTEVVKGFLDTWLLFKLVYPDRHSYSQYSTVYQKHYWTCPIMLMMLQRM